MKTLLTCALVAFLSVLPTSVEAQSVRVGEITGTRGDWIASQLSERLGAAGVEVTDGAPVEISGRVLRRGRRHVLRLRLDRGGEFGFLLFRRRSVERLLNEAVAQVAELLSGGGPGSTTEPDPDPDPDPTSESAREPTSESAREPDPASGPPPGFADDGAIEYSAGLDWMTRTLSFQDDLFDRLGDYELPAAPAITVSARWFPALHATSHPLAGFGISGRFQGAFGVSSTTPDGMMSFATTIDQFAVGLVYRVRVAEVLRIEAMLDYGEARFRVDPEGPAGPSASTSLIPSVHYRFVRPALALGVHLPEGFLLRGGVGWRSIVDAGPLTESQWFPRSSTTGVDLSVDLTWRFDRWFALRLHAEHVRYLTEIAPEPGDALVAGGAADEWTSAGADFVVIIPGAR